MSLSSKVEYRIIQKYNRVGLFWYFVIQTRRKVIFWTDWETISETCSLSENGCKEELRKFLYAKNVTIEK